jgi:hypothetical protein
VYMSVRQDQYCGGGESAMCPNLLYVSAPYLHCPRLWQLLWYEEYILTRCLRKKKSEMRGNGCHGLYSL